MVIYCLTIHPTSQRTIDLGTLQSGDLGKVCRVGGGGGGMIE